MPAGTAGGRRFLARSTPVIDGTPGEVIELEVTDDAISYPASCNIATVAYWLADGVLHLSDAGMSTAVACSAEEDAAAPRIGEVLHAQPRFVIDGDVLTIAMPAADLRFLDAGAPNPDDLPLIGTDWRIAWVVNEMGGAEFNVEGGDVRFSEGVADVTVACIDRIVPTTVDPGPGPGASSGLLDLRAAAPPTTFPVPPPPPTTTPVSTAPPPTTPATPPIPCDPDHPSDWTLSVLDSLTGPLTVEIDIDQAHLRRADGSGIDLIALAG